MGIRVPKLLTHLDGVFMAMLDINYATSEHQLFRLPGSSDIAVGNCIYFKIILMTLYIHVHTHTYTYTYIHHTYIHTRMYLFLFHFFQYYALCISGETSSGVVSIQRVEAVLYQVQR